MNKWVAALAPPSRHAWYVARLQERHDTVARLLATPKTGRDDRQRVKEKAALGYAIAVLTELVEP